MSTAAVKRRTYPASLRAECREMREAGWTAYKIHKILVERMGDQAPSEPTIHYWTDDARYERFKAQCRARSARKEAGAATFRLSGTSDEYTTAFCRRLRDEGIALNAIAKVCRVVFDDPSWTYGRVRYALEGR